MSANPLLLKKIMIDMVIDNIYIGDANSVISKEGHLQLKLLKITHVLTVAAMRIPDKSCLEGIEYKFLFMLDMISQNIFSDNLLSDALEFMEAAIDDEGTVLVHCEIGVSRSATIVMAYMMRHYKWNVEKALIHIRNIRPIAHPNDGFLRQLEIFRKMGYVADRISLARSTEYQSWCSSTGSAIPSETVTFEPCVEESIHETANRTEEQFRCRKCRKTLFYENHLIKHESSSSGGTPEMTQYFNGLTNNECNFGYLILPMKWMDLSSYEGKICCPSCGEKLGNYIWGGRVCLGVAGRKCNTAVRPWIHLHMGKVDRIKKVKIAIIVSPPKISISANERDKKRADNDTPLTVSNLGSIDKQFDRSSGELTAENSSAVSQFLMCKDFVKM